MNNNNNSETNCIFCKIISKEIPAKIIYQSALVISFMDINPVTDGHVLVVPKEHVLWVWDTDKYDEYMFATREVALMLRKAFNTDMIFSKIYGLDVPHAHISLFPAHPSGSSVNSFTIEENFNKIINS